MVPAEREKSRTNSGRECLRVVNLTMPFVGLPLRQRAAFEGGPLTPFPPPKQPLSETEPSPEMAYFCSAVVAWFYSALDRSRVSK